MKKNIFVNKSEFSKLTKISKPSLSNMQKRFRAGTKTKYQFSENGEVIVSSLEYNRLVKLFRENEKKEIIDFVEETKNNELNELINFFSKEMKEMAEINKKIELQQTELIEQNCFYKQHIEKQEEALNQLIKLTKEQSSKLKELETRKITVKFGTEKIENIIDSKFNNNFLELEKKIEENKVLENKIYNFKKKVKKILMIFSIVILSLVYCYFVINDFLK